LLSAVPVSLTVGGGTTGDEVAFSAGIGSEVSELVGYWSTRRRIIDMDRQEAALIIVGVRLRQLLVAVHNIDRVVDDQDNRPGWLLVTPAPDIDQGVGQADDLA
jgi:hypothetical protein